MSSQHTGDNGRVALSLFSLRVPGVEEAFHSKDFLLSHFPRQTLRKRVGGEGTSGKPSAPSEFRNPEKGKQHSCPPASVVSQLNKTGEWDEGLRKDEAFSRSFSV